MNDTMNVSAHPEDFGAVKFVLANHKWQYRGEGNANIAINLAMEKKVVRFPKSTIDDPIDDLDSWQWLSLSITFITTIMKPLLGSMFVSSPSLIYFSSDEIKYLNKTLTSIRPENRKDKVLSFCGAELCDDHAFLPDEMSMFCQSSPISVELKPKQGVFPHSEKHLRNCAFCCKQQLKLKDGRVSQRSQYCPLDLFSGCFSRMKHALMSLLHSPQNNLRIFCDGYLAYDDGHSINGLLKVLSEWLHSVPGSDLLERFSSLLLQALTTKFCSSSEMGQEHPQNWVYDGTPRIDPEFEMHSAIVKDALPHLSQPPCDYDEQDLPEGCILYNLAQAQALNSLGTTSVHSLLKTNEDYRHLIRDKKTRRSASINYVKDIVKKGCSSKLNPIELYLISAAARDCSILITFQEMKKVCPEARAFPQVEDNPSKTSYLFQISAVDIDPKPLSCIKSHMQRNASIWDACRQGTT